jgi:hypothetical protein
MLGAIEVDENTFELLLRAKFISKENHYFWPKKWKLIYFKYPTWSTPFQSSSCSVCNDRNRVLIAKLTNLNKAQQNMSIKPAANLINVLAAFFKPVCVLILLEAYFDSYKQFKCLNILPEAQKQPQAIGH